MCMDRLMQIALEGQTALVVHQGGAVGDAICAALGENGASVSVRVSGGDDPAAALKLVAREQGRLDVLVIVAGFAAPNATKVIDPAIEAVGYVNAAADALAQDKGRIVIVGSVFGVLPARLDPMRGAIDGALFQLMRALAMELGPRGVRINGLALGPIASQVEGQAPLLAGDGRMLSHVPSKRPGSLSDITNAMLFLVDPASTYLTGHILVVDGGWSAGFARDF